VPRLQAKGLIGAALGAVGILIAGVAPPNAVTGSGSKANVWLAPGGGQCSRSATPRRYSRALACGSLAAAYTAAAPRDTVAVARGSYGRQVLGAGTKPVTIQNAPGARPVFGTTQIDASNVRLTGVTIRRTDDPGPNVATLLVNGSHDVFNRIQVNTKNMRGRQGIGASGDWDLFENGSTFNVIDEKGALVGGSHVTFVNFNFHDVRVTGSLIHNECVFSDGPNLTVRRSHFWHCPTMDLFITRGDWWNQQPYGGVTIENNVFEHSRMESSTSWHYYGLLFGGQLAYDGAPLENLKVRYNTFETSVSLGDFKAVGDSEWVGNVGGGWNCIPGMRYRHNVGQKCSATDRAVSRPSACGPPACQRVRVAAQGWVNPARHNFHLRRGAPAIGAGDPADYPRLDKDGRRRPAGRAPDAGAYEYRAGR
jgi:hypothetical protein